MGGVETESRGCLRKSIDSDPIDPGVSNLVGGVETESRGCLRKSIDSDPIDPRLFKKINRL